VRLLITLLLAMIFWTVGCSNTASVSIAEDDEASVSSGSKDKGSSSASEKDGDSSDSKDSDDSKADDCVGDSGKPWDGTTAKEFACGAGTKLSPYIILTAEQLAHLSFVIGASDKDYLSKYYKLGADIILNDGEIIDDKGALVADSSKLHKWTPIGNSSVAFAGNFDGDGHTVSGMFINTTSTHNGLFGNSTGTIQNLTVENGWVYGGKYTASVVGYSDGLVEDVLNRAAVTSQDDCIGGILGSSARRNYKYNSTIKNAINEGIVVGGKNVGGVAGCATYVTVDGAENKASIDGFAYVGGVLGGIGSTRDNDFQNMKNNASVTGVHFVGGVAGHCGGSTSIYSYNNTSTYYCSDGTLYPCGSFKNAKNESKVVGERYVGGVLGMACSADISGLANHADIKADYGVGGVIGSVAYSTTKSVYNIGRVSGSEYVGGIFGYNKEGVTSSAYSIGKVDGDTLVGLMIGYNYNTTMADYYYLEQDDLEPFGKNDGGGVATPKTEKEMKSEEFAKLLGEDFVYDSGLNDGYPVLK